MYKEYKVYGPYVGQDGRYRVVLKHLDTLKLRCISYPRYLMSLHLNRELLDTESVDHIDRDIANNSIDNFRLVSQKVNSSQDAKRLLPVLLQCQVCSKEFILEGIKLHKAYQNKKRRLSSGPYCSASCGVKSRWLGITSNILPELQYYYIDKH